MSGMERAARAARSAQRARQAEATATERPTRIFRVEHEGVVTESVFDPHAFAECAGWPWETDIKRELRNANRFDHSRLFQIHATRQYLPKDFPAREGERPVTHDQCPHGMLTQQTPAALLERFKAEAAAQLAGRTHVHVTQRSVVSLHTTAPCFVVDNSTQLPDGLKESFHVREFAHIHAPYDPHWGWSAQQGGGGGSQHTTLAPADCRELIEKGWAEWHPVATTGHPLVLVYAPRDEVEVKLCVQVLEAATDFMLSRETQICGSCTA